MNGRDGSRRTRRAALIATLALSATATAHASQPGSVDYRRADRAGAAVPANVAAARREDRARMGRFALLQVAPSGGVRAYGRLDGLLTAASTRPATDVALDYVRARPSVFGLDAADLSGLKLVRHYGAAGVEQLRWQQSFDGIPAIDTSLTANLTTNGRLINVLGAPRHDLTLGSVTPKVTANGAYASAAGGLGGAIRTARGAPSGPQRTTSFGGLASAKLVIYESGGPRLGWRLIVPVDRTHVYDVLVDATTGVVERTHNLVDSITATVYRDYPGAPGTGGTAQTVPFDSYLDPGATTLSGPDAHTFTDADDVVQNPGDVPPPAGEVGPTAPGGNWNYALTNVLPCAASLPCVWDPSTPDSWQVNREADATQVHWFVSNYHDYLATTPAIGFTVAAGNFQGDDPVVAQNMDGANTGGGLPDANHVDNANMSTYPDGTSPLMQMYLTEDGGHEGSTGLDASVIYHEYTHGLVGRTITDATGSEAVSGAQSGAFNEGTADFYAEDYLVGQGLETDSPAARDVTLGKFAFAGGDLRSEPMDCDVGDSSPPTPCSGGDTGHDGGYTYGDFGTVSFGPEVHADGEIWAQTMWQLRQVLITRLGASAGEDAVRRLLTNGMRLVPDNPTYLDLRNAILQAAAVADPSGADAADVWTVFAARGMGYFASTTSSSDTQPFADFSLPPAPASPTATVAGTITDADSHAPVAGLKVAFTGHDSGVGPDLSATTNASGIYTIAGVPPGTYPLLRVRGAGGYAGRAANVVVGAPGTTTQDFSLHLDRASADAGAQVASFDGPDLTSVGCGPGAAIDLDPGLIWGSVGPGDSTYPGPKSLVVKLAAPIDLTGVAIDPTAGCGDDDSASLGQYEVQVSPDGTTFTSVAGGTFTSADLHRDNAVALSSAPSGTRYVKLIAKTSQHAVPGDSGTFFIDVAELLAFGTPTVLTPPPPAPPPPPSPSPPPVVTPPPPPVITPLPPPLPPPPPPVDTTAPQMKLSGRTIQQLARTMTVGVTCTDEPCTVRATARVRVPAARGHRAKTLTLGPATARLKAKGTKVTLALKLGATARATIRRALFAHKKVSATITITASDQAGNARTLTRTVKLKR